MVNEVVCGFALVVHDGVVYATKNRKYGLYHLIGGKAERGEDAKACLDREVKEETGASVVSAQYLGNARAVYPDMKVFEHYYVVRVDIRPRTLEDGSLIVTNDEVQLRELEAMDEGEPSVMTDAFRRLLHKYDAWVKRTGKNANSV